MSASEVARRLLPLLKPVLRNGSFSVAAIVAAMVFVVGYRRLKIAAAVVRSIAILGRTVAGPEKKASLMAVFKDVHKNHLHRLNDYLVDGTKKYGRTWHVAHFLIVTTPENVQHILKDNFENYNKGNQFTLIFHDLLGDGIFNANGENWRVQRKTASKMFSRKAFTTYMNDTFYRHGNTVLEILQKHAASKTTFDLQELFYRFTLDSIGEIGFGVDLQVLKTGKIPFSEAFDESQARLLQRFVNPFWHFLRFTSPEEWKQSSRMQVIHSFTKELLKKKKEEGVTDRMDILSYFLERTDENGQPFSDEYLQDIVMNFIIAGRDTTAATLSWSFYCLAKYPEARKKLLEEIDTTLRGQKPTYDDIDNHLPYLHAFVKEVLRLYPPVPKDVKNAVKDDTLPDGTFVPAGTLVVFTPYVMGRLEEMYENPLQFEPERWMREENIKKNLFEYPVFQAGPRTCLGMSMAYFESKLLITLILQKFRVETKPGFEAFPAESVTMPIVDGLPVTIHERDHFYFQ